MVNVTVNGKTRQIAPGATVGDYLGQLGINPLAVAVEHNGAVLKRELFDATPVREGDRLEVVRMMGGG